MIHLMLRMGGREALCGASRETDPGGSAVPLTTTMTTPSGPWPIFDAIAARADCADCLRIYHDMPRDGGRAE